MCVPLRYLLLLLVPAITISRMLPLRRAACDEIQNCTEVQEDSRKTSAQLRRNFQQAVSSSSRCSLRLPAAAVPTHGLHALLRGIVVHSIAKDPKTVNCT